jgi:pyridoxamine 5'-phosphate oxidase
VHARGGTIVSELDGLSERLRTIPVFAGDLPVFDVEGAPDDPAELFAQWIRSAIDAGVREPHAMSLSTVDAAGHPNARVLIVKGVTADGAWRFAGSRATTKGDELAAVPHAAATFYWPDLGRQVRLRGPVREAGAEASAADFLARGTGARAETLIGRQGHELHDPAELATALAESEAAVVAEPGAVSKRWTLWEIVAEEVEFTQGDAQRRHTRLAFARSGNGWTRRRLWP